MPRLRRFRQNPSFPGHRAIARGGDQLGNSARGGRSGRRDDRRRRLASPGMVRSALRAGRLHPRPVIATLGFHLGPQVQMESVRNGYCQAVEDRLLEEAGWTEDGYRLFDISAFAGSSSGGWFAPIAESNALFMTKTMWNELGGFDERFTSPGGGLVNLDTYARACELPASQLIMLLGEGTFHQVHGGVATNAASSPWDAFHTEYVRLRGKPFAISAVQPWYVGELAPQTLPSIESSARTARATTRAHELRKKEASPRPRGVSGRSAHRLPASRCVGVVLSSMLHLRPVARQ